MRELRELRELREDLEQLRAGDRTRVQALTVACDMFRDPCCDAFFGTDEQKTFSRTFVLDVLEHVRDSPASIAEFFRAIPPPPRDV